MDMMDGWMDGWMDGRMDGWTDRRTDGRIATLRGENLLANKNSGVLKLQQIALRVVFSSWLPPLSFIYIY